MTATSTLSRETLWLRFAGMALLLVGLVSVVSFADALDSRQILQNSTQWATVLWVAVWLIAANMIALGIVLLLAGLRRVSLRSSARARRGTIVRMGAANVLVVCFAFVALQDAGALDDVLTRWYLAPVLLGAFVLAARYGVATFRSGWKYDARAAEEALAMDPRPPVLYLRSFEADPQMLVTGGGFLSRAAALLSYAASVSPEQELAFILDRIGPVVAIGKPGERLPELGAARRYVGDDQWRDVVLGLMRDAALVVIRAGNTGNLWWEIEQALTRCPRGRVIIVALGRAGSFPAFEQRFAEVVGDPARRADVRSSRADALLRFMSPYSQSAGRIIYFDRRGMPLEEALYYKFTWTGFVLVAFRPHRDALQAAFRNVFAELGLPWTPKRSLSVAVLLALGGGIFGLHHFYMGHVRAGLWYLAFFWTAIPMVLGWIDAGRLALLDDEEFRKRLKMA